MEPTPRHGILDLGLYPVGGAGLPGVARTVNLANNENVIPPSPRAVAACREAAAAVNRYPDPHCVDLREALADRHGLDPARIVCGNGSGELIALLAMAYAGPGDEVLLGTCSYLYFRTAARIAGATPVAAAMPGMGYDADALLAALTPKTRMVFIANPNNPSGALMPHAELARVVEGVPEDVLVVLDAAYAEFAEDADYDAGEGFAARHANVVSLRTFSKVYGLAGARIGWAYGSERVAGVLNRVRTPDNVAAPSQAAAIAALGDREHVAGCLAQNAELRAWFTERVAALGLHPYPSATNFVLVRFDSADAAADADAALKARGIMVRPMGSYDLPDHLRVTIGTADDMQAVVDVLGDVAAAGEPQRARR